MRSFERTWWASLARSDLLNAEDAWLQASGTQNQARRPKLTHHDLIISRNRHRPIIAVIGLVVSDLAAIAFIFTLRALPVLRRSTSTSLMLNGVSRPKTRSS